MSSHSISLPFDRSHAFIIGINDYQHVSPLKTAVNDAKSIANKLQSEHDYVVHGPLLNPTRSEMLDFMAIKMMNEVGENDRVIFYFAGHGIALDGEEGPNGYLVPADARQGVKESLIPMEDLHWSLNELPCRHGLLILDCCFSGAFKWSSGYRDLVFDLPKVVYEERFWRYTKDPAWQVITSSAYDQKAVDVISNQSIGLREEGQGQHSPFALSLLEALDGAADVIPAEQGDGVITASELYAYLRDGVETQTTENVKRQSPSMFNLGRHDKGEFIFLNPNHRFNLPPTPDRNPFMGLASYNETDQAFFFGRDRAILELVEKLQDNALVVVSGASGTGKSSVIKAGVLPKLRKAGYEILPTIRPGKEPMQVIQTELRQFDHRVSGKKVVLVIDQYEELITQCLREEEREEFERQIAQWLQQYPELRIILSIRSDFEPQFESDVLASWWLPGRYVVPAFSLEEIREVITRPAAQAVLFYEPVELVEQLSEEVSQAPGALPLLSFTLSELYHIYLKSGRQDRALKEEDYQQLGGVIGALRTRADAEYMSLDGDGKHSMRTLMMRMVSLEGGELAGKRVYADELIFSNETETNRLQSIANQLVEARLLLRGKDGQGRIYVEPAHDALVRAWARLWEWIKTIGEEKLIWQNKLSQAVVDHQDLFAAGSPKAKNLLWDSNPRLDILQAELETETHGLNAKEETFVRSSIALKAQKRRRFITQLVGVIAVLAVIATVAVFQFFRANETAGNLNIALTDTKSLLSASRAKEVADTDPTHSLRLAEAAYDTASNKQQASILQSIATAYDQAKDGYLYLKKWDTGQGQIDEVIVSSNGQHVLTIDLKKGAKLWTIEGKLISAFQEVNTAVFHSDQQHLLISSTNKTLSVWDLEGNLIGSQSMPEEITRLKISKHTENAKLLLGSKYTVSVVSLAMSNSVEMTVQTSFTFQQKIEDLVFYPTADSFLVLKRADYELFIRSRSEQNAWKNHRYEFPPLRSQFRDSLMIRDEEYGMVSLSLSSAGQVVDIKNNRLFTDDWYVVEVPQGGGYRQSPRHVVFSIDLRSQAIMTVLDSTYEEAADVDLLTLLAVSPNDGMIFMANDREWYAHQYIGKTKYDYEYEGMMQRFVGFNDHDAPINHVISPPQLPGKYITVDINGILIFRQSPETLWATAPWPADAFGIIFPEGKLHENLEPTIAYLDSSIGEFGWEHTPEDSLQLSDGYSQIIKRKNNLIRTNNKNEILQTFIDISQMNRESGRYIYEFSGIWIDKQEQMLIVQETNYYMLTSETDESFYAFPTAEGILEWLEEAPIPSLAEIESMSKASDQTVSIAPVPTYEENKILDIPRSFASAQAKPRQTKQVAPQGSTMPQATRTSSISKFGTVLGNSVRVRQSPEIVKDPEHTLMRLYKGDHVEILEEKLPPGEKIHWYKVKTGATIGWMRSDFVERNMEIR